MNQKELHKKAVQKLSEEYAKTINNMTLETAMNVSIDFAVASLLYVFNATGKQELLNGDTIGKEIASRIDELKGKIVK